MKLNAVVVALGLVASSFAVQAADKAAQWGYTGKTGAENWGDLDPAFSTCKSGKEQSPINIKDVVPGNLAPLDFNYTGSPAEIVNNGHTIQVNLNAGGSLKLADGEYKLVQYHFHTPSEEQVNGVHFPMVAHLVHKSDAGNLAVVAVLFKEGKENAALKQVFANMPVKAGANKAMNGDHNAEAMLPTDLTYYAFKGSLTTPPCSENVRWHVLKTPAEVSKEQINAFKTLYPMNARPVQPLNNRQVQISG